jgi:hypothetical protein
MGDPFGVSLVTHPDEPNILESSLAMVHNHDPQTPTFLSTRASLLYVEAGVVALV